MIFPDGREPTTGRRKVSPVVRENAHFRAGRDAPSSSRHDRKQRMTMGMDLGFTTTGGAEVVTLRNHWDFFAFFPKDGESTDPDSNNIYVRRTAILKTLAHLINDMCALGLSAESVPAALDECFLLHQPADRETLLPGDVRLCIMLLDVFGEEGDLVFWMTA